MKPDEPLFDAGEIDSSAVDDPSIADRIRKLLEIQPYGVLCLQGEGQPYGALVAFAFSEDLRTTVFCTPVTTRKYRILRMCDHVALVVDNRPDRSSELMEIEAVTATGCAKEIERGGEFDRWADLLVSRHAYLRNFVAAETCALFRIEVVRFLHVVRFQEVRQWIPTDPR